MAFIRENVLNQISDDLLTISPSLGKSVNNLLMNTLVSPFQADLSPSHFAIMKALNDLFLNDYIEQGLLDRRIESYWKMKNKEEQQRKRMQDSLKTFQQDFNTTRIPEISTYQTIEESELGNEFLANLQ